MSVFKQIKTLENDLFCMKYIVYVKEEIRVCQCSEAKQIAELVVAKFAELNRVNAEHAAKTATESKKLKDRFTSLIKMNKIFICETWTITGA